MFDHPLSWLMTLTFLAAAGSMMAGVITLGKPGQQRQSNKLMRLRVALCLLLLAEILIYAAIVKS